MFKKTLYGIFTLFSVITFLFFLFYILPSDPARMMLDQRETQEQVDIVKAKYGLDKPYYMQYLYYINDVSPISFHSNQASDFTFLEENKYNYISLLETQSNTIVIKTPYFRTSYQKKGKKVSTIIIETLPNTIILAVSSITIAIVIGLLLGIFCAMYSDTFIEKLIINTSAIGISVPSFFSAIIFSWIFGFVLHKYTGLNMSGSLYSVDDFGEGVFLELKNLILPSIVLGIRPISVIIPLVKNSILETYNQDFVRTAKAKGLSKISIIKNHVFKNSMNPVITVVSGWFASLLAGAVYVEYIFNWNGLGKEIVDALNTLDLPVVMGSITIISLIFIIINIIVDKIYTLIDPRLIKQ